MALTIRNLYEFYSSKYMPTSYENADFWAIFSSEIAADPEKLTDMFDWNSSSCWNTTLPPRCTRK